MDIPSALDAFRQWPLEDQIEFVHKAWDEILDAGWTPELTEAQKAELDRRLAAYEADPSNVLTWDEVLAHLRRET
jgi:putative addiction module component (TIGR02574 family)